MDELLSNRAKNFDAMMNMKVMEAEDFRKHFMQTIEAMVKKGMEQDNSMNKKVAIRKKDKKEMVQDVRKSFMRAT
jgi:hypothetical protein